MVTSIAVSEPRRACGKPVSSAQEGLLHRAHCNHAARRGEYGVALELA